MAETLGLCQGLSGAGPGLYWLKYFCLFSVLLPPGEGLEFPQLMAGGWGLSQRSGWLWVVGPQSLLTDQDTLGWVGGALRLLSLESLHIASLCTLPGFQVLGFQVQPQHVFQQGLVRFRHYRFCLLR